MLKRTLFFGSRGRLFLERSLLAYEAENREGVVEKRTFPLEDLGFLVLETQQLSVTTACLSALASENIAVVFCDASHMPAAVLQPFAGNTLTQRHTEAQLRASAALKDRLWRQTVQAKILNQAACLQRLGLPDQRLRMLAGTVKAGDSGNAEGVAARCYFQQHDGGGEFSAQPGREPSESRAELRLCGSAGGGGAGTDGFRPSLRGGDSSLQSI